MGKLDFSTEILMFIRKFVFFLSCFMIFKIVHFNFHLPFQFGAHVAAKKVPRRPGSPKKLRGAMMAPFGTRSSMRVLRRSCDRVGSLLRAACSAGSSSADLLFGRRGEMRPSQIDPSGNHVLFMVKVHSPSALYRSLRIQP